MIFQLKSNLIHAQTYCCQDECSNNHKIPVTSDASDASDANVPTFSFRPLILLLAEYQKIRSEQQ